MMIRIASYRETQDILDQSLEVLKEATMGHATPNREKALQMVSPFLASGGYYLVAVENNAVEGWIGVGSTTDYLTGKMIGIIPEIYVLPVYRKKGIAEKLCVEAFNRLKAGGYKRVQLHVYAGNRVKRLYQKLGFEEVSTLMEIRLGE